MDTITSIEVTLSEERLHILRHALGLDDAGQPPPGRALLDFYRNRYVAGPGHYSWADLQALCDAGLMDVYSLPGMVAEGDVVFFCTEAGKAAAVRGVRMRKPSRYEQWRDVRDVYDMTFGEWLKRGLYKEERVREFFGERGAE